MPNCLCAKLSVFIILVLNCPVPNWLIIVTRTILRCFEDSVSYSMTGYLLKCPGQRKSPQSLRRVGGQFEKRWIELIFLLVFLNPDVDDCSKGGKWSNLSPSARSLLYNERLRDFNVLEKTIFLSFCLDHLVLSHIQPLSSPDIKLSITNISWWSHRGVWNLFHD